MPRCLGASVLVGLIVLSSGARAEERSQRAASVTTSRGPTTWLVASGGVVFGATYLISFGMASAGQGCGNAFLGMDCVPKHGAPGTDWPLFVPVVGPFVALATSKDRPAYTLALLGAGQIVGAALLVCGVAIRTPQKPGDGLVLSPSIFAGGGGLHLSRQF
jgi:hypothetical protein